MLVKIQTPKLPPTPCKRIGVDRYNTGFLSSLDETERLSIFLATKTYSPESHNDNVFPTYVEGTVMSRRLAFDSPSKQQKKIMLMLMLI